MRGRLSLFLLLASALTFLASLFLPWRDTTASVGNNPQGALNLFEGGSVSGWVSSPADVAALVAVALVVATVAALRRPQLAPRLPIGSLGFALGYFAVATALAVRALSRVVSGGFTGVVHPPHTSWAYGFYLGLASAAVAALSGVAFRRGAVPRPRDAADRLASVVCIALLIAFLLPWEEYGPTGDSLRGVDTSAVPVVALGLVLGARWLNGDAGRRWRLPCAIAAAILVGGAVSGVGLSGGRRYGAWIGVACAVLLVALEAVRAWSVRLPARPRGPAAVRAGAGALLLVALFLPWQVLHAENVSANGNDGWYFATGSAAGSLCLLLLAALALPALEKWALDVVVAIVILVSALGTQFRTESFFYGVGYGAFVGFAAAGILLAGTLLPLRPVRLDRKRALARAVPLAASILCVAAIVVPWWYVLPSNWELQATPLYFSGWVSVTGLLMALYLVRLWVLRIRGSIDAGGRLTLVPLTVLALASLELIRFRNGEVMWGAVILVGLCLLLAVLGWFEQGSRLEGVRVPEEIWRVDRLPEPEG